MKPLIAIEIVTDVSHRHLLGLGAAEICRSEFGGLKIGMTWGDWAERPHGVVAPPCYPPEWGRLSVGQLWRRLEGFLILCGWQPGMTSWDMVSSEGWEDWLWLMDKFQLTGVIPTPVSVMPVGPLFPDDDAFPNAEMMARRAAQVWINGEKQKRMEEVA